MIIKFYLEEKIINPNIKLHTTREHIIEKFTKKKFTILNTVVVKDIKDRFNIKTGNFTEYPIYSNSSNNETHTNIFYCWNDPVALERFENDNLKIDIMKYNYYRFLDKDNKKIIQIAKQNILEKLKSENEKMNLLEINTIKKYFNIENYSSVLECFNEIQQLKTFRDKDIINLDDYKYYMIMTSSLY